MKRRNGPGRLRADGEVKGLQLVRLWGWIDGEPFRPYQARYRTSSRRRVAGTRHVKKWMRRLR